MFDFLKKKKPDENSEDQIESNKKKFNQKKANSNNFHPNSQKSQKNNGRNYQNRNNSKNNAGQQGKNSSNTNSNSNTNNAQPVTTTRKRGEFQNKNAQENKKYSTQDLTMPSELELATQRQKELTAVKRTMIIRKDKNGTQVSILEDNILAEHFVALQKNKSIIGNIYYGVVQSVLTSMETAFVSIGEERNAVLYSGEVNWDSAGLDGSVSQAPKLDQLVRAGEKIIVQVTKNPVLHKGARLTSQISIPGRFIVFLPFGGAFGVSRRIPQEQRNRIKTLLKDLAPAGTAAIARTSAENASDDDIVKEFAYLVKEWEKIESKAKAQTSNSPALLRADLSLGEKTIRDVYDDSFDSLIISGEGEYEKITKYMGEVAPKLLENTHKWVEKADIFEVKHIQEQLAKGLDRKVYLPSGGSIVIDKTEAMTVIDVNTGRFTGKNEATLEEIITINNLESAEEIVRQLRLRDVGGIIVIDFVDMNQKSNQKKVLDRLVECLSLDRARYQVSEITSLGLVQMTRKRIGIGLIESFSKVCEHCQGKGYIPQQNPVTHVSVIGSIKDENPTVAPKILPDGSLEVQNTSGKNSAKNGSKRGSKNSKKTPKEIATLPESSKERTIINEGINAVANAMQQSQSEQSQSEQSQSEQPLSAEPLGVEPLSVQSPIENAKEEVDNN